MTLSNVPLSNEKALNHQAILNDIGLLIFLGWKFEFHRDEKNNVYEVVALYKHFFKSRRFIEQDPFYDWALHRTVKRIYEVMEEYKWQYPKYEEYLREAEWMKSWELTD
jgi:hypothetical protein